jgi:hypothetical protein
MVYNEALRHSLRYATVYVTPQSTLRYILRYAITYVTPQPTLPTVSHFLLPVGLNVFLSSHGRWKTGYCDCG